MKSNMEILKSSRHAKLTGDFGESLVLYWLSKYGFECAQVDRTGIDLIARNPHTNEIMGVSVKSRSRNPGKEETYVNIPNDNFKKAEEACKAFGCVSYFAIVIDAADVIRTFLMQMSHLLKLSPMRQRGAGWKMTKAALEKYYADPEIKIFELRSQTVNWWRK
ncbi:MAG TPA: hypothetical protein DCK87_06735 [Desulfotomaculum sp.]|nr:hypothetical protein [Desulfotomaculum sp.]